MDKEGTRSKDGGSGMGGGKKGKEKGRREGVEENRNNRMERLF